MTKENKEQKYIKNITELIESLKHAGHINTNINTEALFRIMHAAEDMYAEGPNSNSPLARLLKEDTMGVLFNTLMSSMDLTQEEKIRGIIIIAATIIGMREYEITYS